ncbi:hypothetical protein HHI36_012449 [Cryptolaemus montrouzieri]|uniref:SCP domain-containing protein n=1 Tax=Cryptolaemus montrouzieri TaxID=559131 RepID=A0ABD2NFR0_9CUCU
MSLWLAEIEVINERAIQNIPRNEAGTRIDNFAQVLSDRVLYVGCSWSRSVDWMLFVCTFAPRGPYLEEPIYKIGPICSSCPYGFACNYREPYEKLCKPGTMGLTKKVTLQSNNNSRASNLQELEFPKRSDEESKKDSKEKKNPILLAIIIFMGFSIFICIFLSIVFLIIHYLLNW